MTNSLFACLEEMETKCENVYVDLVNAGPYILNWILIQHQIPVEIAVRMYTS